MPATADIRKNMDDVSRDASNSSNAGNSRDAMDGSKIRDPAETIHGCQQEQGR